MVLLDSKNIADAIVCAYKSSEVCIPFLQHVKLHFGSGRVSVLKIIIKIAISHGPH